jgi:hypothetical protein
MTDNRLDADVLRKLQDLALSTQHLTPWGTDLRALLKASAEIQELRFGWREVNALVFGSQLAGKAYGKAAYAIAPEDVHGVRTELIDFVSQYIGDRECSRVLDPWSGIGTLLVGLVERPNLHSGLGIAGSEYAAEVAQLMEGAQNIEWKGGDPFQLVNDDLGEFDLIVSCPPWGRWSREITYGTPSGDVYIKDSVDHIIAVMACSLLTWDGEAIFVLPDRFFRRKRNGALASLEQLGFAVHTVLSIPDSLNVAGTSVPASLVFVKWGSSGRWFVGRVADDPERNKVLLENIQKRIPGDDLGLGQLVEPKEYLGWQAYEAGHRVRRMAIDAGLPEIALVDVATEINRTKAKEPPGFEERLNAVYLPTFLTSEAVSLLTELKIKPHNCIQVVLDTEVANAEYVAAFFNSPLGLAVREQITYGAIPRLTKTSLKTAQLYLPDLQTQIATLEVQAEIRTLINELGGLNERLWIEPHQRDRVREQLTKITRQEKREERFTDWIDTLPFPLSSILWTYHASGEDHKRRYEHLLHFFEALSEFMATVLLSGFKNDDNRFRFVRDALLGTLARQNLSLDSSTFGAWQIIVGQLAKQVRILLNSQEEEDRRACRAMFRTQDRQILELLSSKKLVATLQETNSLRNVWPAHGGIASPAEELRRRRILEQHLLGVRECFGTIWERYELLLPGKCTFSSGVYYYEVDRLMGNRTPFETVSREIEHPLDDRQLYLLDANERRALHLLPLVKVMPSPETAQNACYFYNRRHDGGLRFVSYHFETEADIVDQFADTVRTLEMLSAVENPGT